MIEFHDDDDAATDFLERRWFAASAAIEAMEQECETLREVLLVAEDAFRRSRARLAHLAVLRDSLGERLRTTTLASQSSHGAGVFDPQRRRRTAT